MRRFFAPEVVQTSAMDCGPASLKSLLEGFAIPVSYGRLREACQTDVDGTSIDTIEEVAVQLGLDAEQIMVPLDHVLPDEAQTLPALVVVRLPNGLTHFVVVWRRHGAWLQIMDPATGRRWVRAPTFLQELYLHTQAVPAEAWREWAGSDEFLIVLRRRLTDLGLPQPEIERLLAQSLADAGWYSLAALDAATRMSAAIVQAWGVRRGMEAARVLRRFYERALATTDEQASIPSAYWSVRPAPPDEDGEPQVYLRGAVLVRVRGTRTTADSSASLPPLAPDLVAALAEPPTRPARELLRLLRADGLLAPVILLGTLLIEATGVLVEALLFRGLLEIGSLLSSPMQRLGALMLLLILLLSLLLLRLGAARESLRMGRHLESRFRLAFLDKIPRLGDRYFRSRLTSDMAERSHSLHYLRAVPEWGATLLRQSVLLVLTTLALIWLSPAITPLALLTGLLALLLPLLFQSALSERDLRVRTHNGALSRFYLDAMQGLVPIRTHGAAPAIRREHESLLVEWGHAGQERLRVALLTEGVQALVGYGLAIALVTLHLQQGQGAESLLLLTYWALSLPLIGQEIALLARQYPIYRNTTLRLLEPLGAPDDSPADTEEPPPPVPNAAPTALRLENVTVRAAGHTILDDLTLDIPAGSHIAIVGASGAGKSSLVGLLLGWHRPASGTLHVDGQPLTGAALEQLRCDTAWVDPAVQLWNRSFLDNLRYGLPQNASAPLTEVIEQADLLTVLSRMTDGLQTGLGEGGALVSGGEGQRVRLGRALLRPAPRLVILDEPFRGLDRASRRTLLARARAFWRDSTLLCITHDVGETLDFERVLLLDGGRIVEDGDPTALAADPTSAYRAMLDDEAMVREGMWAGAAWRRIRVADGTITEQEGDE